MLNDAKEIRILSVDGGGIRGIIPAISLFCIYFLFCFFSSALIKSISDFMLVAIVNISGTIWERKRLHSL
ncbi:MAG: hypothetical protein LBL16_05150 [Endomicrobium sp.]|jgi:hypothetical protein|nr:hypothetical protein [Endomicrobium sp.]